MPHPLQTLFLISCFFSAFFSFSQIENGTYKGLFFPKNSDKNKGTIVSFIINDNNSETQIRMESVNGKNVAIKKASFEYVDNQSLTLKESVILRKSKENTTMWCKYNFTVNLDTLDGYFKGSYTSTDCANQSGNIILYRSNDLWLEEVNTKYDTHKHQLFLDQLSKGIPSPDQQLKERKSFVLHPIFFEFDKAELKQEYIAYLNKMSALIQGHSDIRIKVTGHTDAVGSDVYNDQLSKLRAKVIENYFNTAGISTNRLIFDFKGERLPAATNETKEGRQLNRRVDFEFIYD